MRKVLAVLLVALIMLEPASSLSIQAKAMSDSGSGSSAKDDGDNETKEDGGSQASLPFSGGDADDTKKNGIAAGGAFIIGLLVGVAAVKSGSSGSGKNDKAEGEEGEKKDDPSSNPSSSSPGNDKKSLEEEDDDEFDAPMPVVHHEAKKPKAKAKAHKKHH